MKYLLFICIGGGVRFYMLLCRIGGFVGSYDELALGFRVGLLELLRVDFIFRLLVTVWMIRLGIFLVGCMILLVFEGLYMIGIWIDCYYH